MKARIPQGAGGAGNMNQMMQRMQKMQEEMTRAQAELEEKVYHVSAGGGNIEVEINGKKEITAVTLKPEVVDPDDIEFLQDLIREMKQILLIIPRFHRYLKYRERKISTLHAQTAGFQMRWIRIIMCTKKCLKLFSAGKRKSLIFRAWESRW